jgi:hypothetical protein
MPDRTPPRAAVLCCLALVSSWLVPAQPAPAQQAEPPLLRTFKAGDVQRYRVELTVRSEVSGQRPRQVGRQTFAEPFTDTITTMTHWKVTRRVVAVDPDGSAEMEETLHDFSEVTRSYVQSDQPDQDAPATKALSSWELSLRGPLRYRESRSGQLLGLSENAGPVLDDAPPVLTLWLRRALRPTAALPARAPRVGDRWQEPRTVRLPPWTDTQGTESGTWSSGGLSESAVSLLDLLVVQEISGNVPSAGIQASAGTSPTQTTSRPGRARFHAEALSSLVHAGSPLYGGYGALYSSQRAAIREVSREVANVPNMTGPVVFAARIGVQVRITVIE